MATNFVCPIDGALPSDNGTLSNANGTVPTESDAVVTASGVISSTSGTTVIVTTGANFHVGDYIQIPTRKEKMLITGIASNTLTVTRAQLGTNASGAIAIADVILVVGDVNGQPPHCPVCGSAALVVDPAFVTSLTGVASGSQHPLDINVAYGTNADSPLAQFGATPYTTFSGSHQPVQPRAFSTVSAHTVARGTATVTAETINATQGP